MADQKQSYLEYLDKEMTILGILSTFAVAVVALFLQQIGSAENGKLFFALWTQAGWYVLAGSVSILLSAVCFYNQRAILARHYGRLARNTDEGGDPETLKNLLDDADSWIHGTATLQVSNSFG